MEQVVSHPVPVRGTPLTADQAMRLAVNEAYKGAPGVSPNPLVGCVVLDRQGQFLHSGYHQNYGGPHAEVHALRGLSLEELKDAQVYVTLEPCAHEGKTPSCAKMMAQLPLKKVIYGLVDPNPLVAGQGAEILKKAGVEAELFVTEDLALREQLEEVCEAFLWNFRERKIFVALKMASSLDGQVALRSGESQWITGPEAREEVHFLRACYDAVLVGRGTVEFDNPSLNIRHSKISKANKVVVIDSEGSLLEKYDFLKLAQAHAAENVFWCVAEEMREKSQAALAKLEQGPQIIYVKAESGGELPLPSLLEKLWEKGLRSILVEGGALTASSFLVQGMVNRLYIFQAPILMGSGGAKSWTETLRISSMKNKLVLRKPRYATFGGDLMITGRMK